MKTKGKFKVIAIITAVIIVIGVVVCFILGSLSSFDKKDLQKQYFKFVPDITIGELLNETHQNAYGDKDGEPPLWGETPNDDGDYTIDFDGENIYDGTHLFIEFSEGSEKYPKIESYHIGTPKTETTYEEFEEYIKKVYKQYKGDESQTTEPSIEKENIETSTLILTTEPKTEATEPALTQEQLQQQKLVSFIDKEHSDVFAEFGSDYVINNGSFIDNGGFTSQIDYGDIHFEFPNEFSSIDDRSICGVWAENGAYLCETLKVGMTYKELSEYVDFKDPAPFDDSVYYAKVLAFGEIMIDDARYDIAVSFGDNDGGNVNAASTGIYIYGKYKPTNKEETVTDHNDGAFEGVVKITTGFLNVRDRPSTSGNVIGTLNKDEKVYVEDYDENWFYIKKGNLIGYVSGDYLKCAFVDYMKILYDTYMNYTEYNECFFYDINNDGTTELIVETGLGEADAQYQIYTAKNNEAVFVDAISAAHAVLCESNSGELIIHRAHMGGESVSNIKFENDMIIETHLYSNHQVAEYSNPGTPLEYATLGELFK